jgi:hypothetical protein
MKKPIFFFLITLILILAVPLSAQSPASSDVAAYQLGLVAETLPGSDLTYTITVTNYGPEVVKSFYIVDGWTVNDEGISAFKLPVASPDFGPFALMGAWQQTLDDQELVAWLLQGEILPGATLQFKWIVQVDSAYQGVLVNWVEIQTDGELKGAWQTLTAALPLPPRIENALDSNLDNNRTTDGVTIVTNTPTGQGIDLALYQTGILAEMPAGQPLESTWLVANLGPQPVSQFYVIAGGTLNSDGNSLLALPVAEPDFGEFQVLGRWQQSRDDEKQWLWLLQGELPSGGTAEFKWTRNLIPNYRGDLITWAGVSGSDVPEGSWIAREGTTALPQPTANQADTFPENDNALDALTTIQG